MRLSRFALLGTPLLLTATIAAQSPPIPPAVTKFSATTTATGMGNFEPLTFSPLNALSMGANGQVGQIELRPLISGNVDFFRVAATVSQLNVINGGMGSWDMVEGVYDAANQVLTASNRAAAFNTSSTEFAFSISENGLIGASDSAGGPQWSQRVTASAVFPATQLITGVPTGFIDSKLYTQGNTLKYAWVAASGDIWAGDFQPGGNIVNQSLVIPLSVVQTATSSYTGMHSHHPITEEIPTGSGNYVLHGWLVSGQEAGGDSDSFFVPIADPWRTFSTPAVAHRLWQESSWQNNASTLGSAGTTFWAYGEPAPRCIPMVAMTGTSFDTTVNSTANLHVMTEYTKTDVWQMTILFGAPLAPPIPLNFTIGNPLGQPSTGIPPGLLGNSGIAFVNVGINPTVNPGGGNISFTVPAGSVPANIAIDMQVIGLNATSLKLYTGNTAVLEGY